MTQKQPEKRKNKMKQSDKIKQLLEILEEQTRMYCWYDDKMTKTGNDEIAYFYDCKKDLALDNLIELKDLILSIVRELEKNK